MSPCAVANRSLAFLWWFWSSGFFLAEGSFRLFQYRTRFTVDIDTFVPVSSSIFTTSFAVVLGLICTFRTKVHSSLGDRTRLLLEWYDGCVVPRMNQTYGVQFLYGSWLISFDFLMMSSKEAPTDSNYVN